MIGRDGHPPAELVAAAVAAETTATGRPGLLTADRLPDAAAPARVPAPLGTAKPVRVTRDGRREERPAETPLPKQAKQWGNVARRGAREVAHRDPEGGQRTAFFSDDQERRRRTPPPSRQPKWERIDGARDEWEDSAPKPAKRKAPSAKPATRSRRPAATAAVAGAATAAGARARGTRDTGAGNTAGALAALSNRVNLPPEVAADIRNAADAATAHHRERLVERAEAAYGAYERGRFSDALRAIKPVAEEAPAVAAVRELAGLAAYRSGRWREAARNLQAFGTLSDSTEHLPVLMDCQRALHKPKKVAELWAELRHSSPEPDVLAEGRIVAAAALADAGDLNGAIALLATAGASKALRNPSDRHIRQWYVLGDLYERAGDIPRARDFFERVLRADPAAYDVVQRLRGLGPERKRSRPKTPAQSRSTRSPKSAPESSRSG